MNERTNIAISRIGDLTSDLEALHHTFVAISDALENGEGLCHRALFLPDKLLKEITDSIRDHVQILKEEAGIE